MLLTGIVGFAQKLSIKRTDGAGKTATAFRSDLHGERFLLASMMSDAAAETMSLIRYLDNEQVDITQLCNMAEHHLDHITWMFYVVVFSRLKDTLTSS